MPGNERHILSKISLIFPVRSEIFKADLIFLAKKIKHFKTISKLILTNRQERPCCMYFLHLIGIRQAYEVKRKRLEIILTWPQSIWKDELEHLRIN